MARRNKTRKRKGASKVSATGKGSTSPSRPKSKTKVQKKSGPVSRVRNPKIRERVRSGRGTVPKSHGKLHKKKPLKKAQPKKPLKKKVQPKKLLKKKIQPKKLLKKKVQPKKPLKKKVQPKKLLKKKAQPKKPLKKKVQPKKPLKKKVQPKKPLKKKVQPKKPLKKKVQPKKPLKKKVQPKKPLKKKVQPKKRPLKKKRPQSVIQITERQQIAERVEMDWLDGLWMLLEGENLGLDMRLKSFLYQDGSVDTELRIQDLPFSWTDEVDGLREITAVLSRLLRERGPIVPETEGGQHWVSMGLRFGPQTDGEAGADDLAELYKRFRGLFQVAAYPTFADVGSGLQNNVLSLSVIMKSMMERRGTTPSVLLIRLTWTPDGLRPGRYKGERGGGN